MKGAMFRGNKEESKADRQGIDAGRHREGIVHGRRHRPKPDFHDLGNGELGVLAHGPARSEADVLLESLDEGGQRATLFLSRVHPSHGQGRSF